LRLPDDLWRQYSARAEVIVKLESVYDLCVLGASPDAFRNGVTDSSGTIDEGDVRASHILDDLRKLIDQMLSQ
jgi:hypothetical protein